MHVHRLGSVRRVGAALALLASGAAYAGDLLAGVPGPAPEGPPSHRARLARVNLGEVPDWTVAVGAPLVFNLWDEAAISATVDRATPTDAGEILYGTLDGEADGTFIAVVRNDVLVAEVRSPLRGSWYIHPVGEGLHAVRQINGEEFKPCATDLLAEVPGPGEGVRAPAPSPRDVPTITVMIVYTAQARSGAGGQSGIDAVIDLAIAQANEAYASSQINAKLKLVYRGLVDYAESGSASTDIYRLQDPYDGYIDEVNPIRYCYGADVVTMLVNNFNACGIGFLMCCGGYPEFASHAVNVVDKDCISNFSFAHEVGHNLGCHHDRDNAGGSPAFSYSYGYRTPNQQYRTIMAYAPGTRIGYFSNPNITYQGSALGIPVGQPGEANNALTINNTAPSAAQFLPGPCYADVDHNCFVNGDDFDSFVDWFVAGDKRADYDGNTFVNGDDFDTFVQDFTNGC